MDMNYLQAIVAHLLPDYGSTRIEVQGKPGSGVKLGRIKVTGAGQVAHAASTRVVPERGGLYFSPHGYSNGADFESGAAYVGASRCLYHDVDIDPTGFITHPEREPQPCYADKASAYAAACAVMDHSSLPRPTAVIDSGRGLHLYWRISADMHPTDFEQLGLRMKSLLRTKDVRLAVDTSRGSTPGELMRLPGSINHRSGTYVWAYEGTTLGTEIERTVFDQGLPRLNPAEISLSGRTAAQGALAMSDAALAPVVDIHAGCSVFRSMWDSPATHSSYDAWRAALMIFQSDPDMPHGLALFHQYCQQMPNYDADEITKEFEKGSFRGVPVTCPTLRAAAGVASSACAGCPVFDKHPNGGTCMKAKVYADLERNVAAEASRALPAVEAVSHVVPALNLNIPAGAFEVEDTDDQKWATAPIQLPRMLFDESQPMAGFFYDNTLNLIRVTLEEVEHKMPPDPATGEVVVGTRLEPRVHVIYRGMFVWVESKVLAKQQDELSYANVWAARGNVNSHQFAKFQIPLSKMNDMSVVVSKLLASGVNVQMGMEKALQAYLTEQLRAAPDVSSAEGFGWTVDKPKQGSAFVMANMRLTPSGIAEVANVGDRQKKMDMFKVRGSLDEHLKVLGAYSAHGADAAKLMIAASLAAPLYHVLEQGSLMVSVTGESGSGKSKLLTALQSFWGFRNGMLLTGVDTVNSIMGQLSMMDGLGAYMDEITNMDNEEFSKLAMMVTQGRERGRLDSSAKLKATGRQWNLPIFCTSNQPLHSKIVGMGDTADAARARVMDLFVGGSAGDNRVLRGMTHEQVAELDQLSVDNTGYVGLAMAKYAVDSYDTLAARLRQTYLDLSTTQDASGRFCAALGACAIEGSRMLAERFPNIWTTKEAEMVSIVNRMLKQAAGSRESKKLDALSLVLAIMSDLADRTVRLAPRSGRGAAPGTPRLTVVGGTQPQNPLSIKDLGDRGLAVRTVLGKAGRGGARTVHTTIAKAYLDASCARLGVLPADLVYAMSVDPRFKFKGGRATPVLADLYEDVPNGPKVSVKVPSYVFDMDPTSKSGVVAVTDTEEPTQNQTQKGASQ